MTVQIHYSNPSGWALERIGKFVVEHRGGAALTPNDFCEEGFPVIPKKGIQEGGWLVIDEPTYCSYSFAQNNQRSVVSSEHVVVTLRDLVPTGPSIGLAVRVQKGLEFILSQGTYGLLLDKGMNPDYLCALSNSSAYRKAMQRVMVGSTQVHIRTGEFLDQKFACPPIEEQNKIAEILSTWDKSIEATEKLLENSKKRKKALMQQLLTGKKRLPGFSGEWKISSLSETGKIVSGGTPDTAVEEYWDGGIPWLTPTEVTGLRRKTVGTTARTISLDGLKNSSAKLLPHGTLMVCTRATVGTLAIASLEMTTNQGFKNIIPNDSYSVDFLYHLISFNRKKLIRLSCGSTFLELSKSDFEKISFTMPCRAEQNAIADVLECSDTETWNLEQRLDSLQNEKKALMQQLLTGKKRVKVEATAA